MAPLLEVKDLKVRFRTIEGLVHAVNGVSFTLHDGETLAIVGESGSGKSVTMMSLVGLIPTPPGKIESGEAIFHENGSQTDLLKLTRAELRKVRGGKVGFIFQDPLTSLNPVLSIGQQITETLQEHLGMSREEAQERCIELLTSVGIPAARDRYKAYPHQFSGGMRQRVIIAMAIACTPQIVIADEPTTALDVTVQAQIVDLVNKLRSDLGVAVIWITHDLAVVAGLAERILVMYGGMVMETAQVDDLYKRPQHPYTVGLLGAMPRLDDTGRDRLVSIKGSPPDLHVKPNHCQFAWRCEYEFERCWKEVPPLIQVGENHFSACFYDLEKGKPRDDI